jgi:MarR family multiple antibiotic resistance transcriptional regulator
VASKVPAEASIRKGRGRATAQFFDDVVRCETRLYNALNDRLRERHGIVTSQFEFLRHLHENPDARVADVAATFAIGVGATSKGADRLEAAGWIRRVPNPADRRSSLLQLTASGVELVVAAGRTVDDHLHDLVDPAVTPAQLRAAVEALSVLRLALERDGVGMPTG